MRRFLACDVFRGTQVLLLQACSGLLSHRQADRLAATLGTPVTCLMISAWERLERYRP